MNATFEQHRLAVEHLRHVYGAKVVLEDVSFAAGTGEVIGIIGRNGAGKSTLLRIIAGLVQPTAGRVDLVGKVTAVMTLGLGLYEDLSGRANAHADFEIRGRPRAEWATLDAAIEAFAELGEFYDRPVRTYSTGMKSRLAFSILTHVDPEILIIDEALSAGDSRFATKAYARLRALCAQGSIVLIVSHSMGAIVDLCSRCLWLDGGRIRRDGTPAEVTEAYHQEVREMDDAGLLEELKLRLDRQVLLPGCDLDAPSVSDAPDAAPRTLLYAGDPLYVRLDGCVPGDAAARSAPDLRVVIERLDGLVLSDARMRTTEAGAAIRLTGSFGLEFVQSPLILGTGRYLVSAELLLDERVAARSATLIEVAARHPPSGGHPLLLVPYEMEFVDGD